MIFVGCLLQSPFLPLPYVRMRFPSFIKTQKKWLQTQHQESILNGLAKHYVFIFLVNNWLRQRHVKQFELSRCKEFGGWLLETILWVLDIIVSEYNPWNCTYFWTMRLWWFLFSFCTFQLPPKFSTKSMYYFYKK